MAASIYFSLLTSTRVPSVTTINKLGQESGGLIHAAWQLGIDGKNYREVWGETATAGSVGHLMVEAAIKNLPLESIPFPTNGARALGEHAFRAYQRFAESLEVRWVDSEVSLVSEKYAYGGTIDAIGIARNVYVIGDWKTGKLYPEQHICQMAAYGNLLEECAGHRAEEFHLVRFNRETGDYTHACYDRQGGAIELGWKSFLLKRELYENLKVLRKQ